MHIGIIIYKTSNKALHDASMYNRGIRTWATTATVSVAAVLPEVGVPSRNHAGPHVSRWDTPQPHNPPSVTGFSTAMVQLQPDSPLTLGIG